jgi:hypothetical protein
MGGSRPPVAVPSRRSFRLAPQGEDLRAICPRAGMSVEDSDGGGRWNTRSDTSAMWVFALERGEPAPPVAVPG